MLQEEKKQTNEEESIAIPKLLSAKEVGEILGISAKTVHKLTREGRLGCVQITARERRFTRDLVAKFVKAETFDRDWRWDDAHAAWEAYRNE